MFSTAAVAVLVAGFALVAVVAAWVVRRLWAASGTGVDAPAPDTGWEH